MSVTFEAIWGGGRLLTNTPKNDRTKKSKINWWKMQDLENDGSGHITSL